MEFTFDCPIRKIDILIFKWIRHAKLRNINLRRRKLKINLRRRVCNYYREQTGHELIPFGGGDVKVITAWYQACLDWITEHEQEVIAHLNKEGK